MPIQSSCETLVTTGQVILAGEVKSNTYLDVQQIARDVIKKIGYKVNICLKPILVVFFHEQSADINQGVDRANPEDQGAVTKE
jgi:S-adenosylmethionine synthetase